MINFFFFVFIIIPLITSEGEELFHSISTLFLPFKFLNSLDTTQWKGWESSWRVEPFKKVYVSRGLLPGRLTLENVYISVHCSFKNHFYFTRGNGEPRLVLSLNFQPSGYLVLNRGDFQIHLSFSQTVIYYEVKI